MRRPAAGPGPRPRLSSVPPREALFTLASAWQAAESSGEWDVEPSERSAGATPAPPQDPSAGAAQQRPLPPDVPPRPTRG